jgi:hypothetical protein
MGPPHCYRFQTQLYTRKFAIHPPFEKSGFLANDYKTGNYPYKSPEEPRAGPAWILKGKEKFQINYSLDYNS